MDEKTAKKVFGWLWEHPKLQREVAEGDGDKAPYPSKKAIETALRALGLYEEG